MKKALLLFIILLFIFGCKTKDEKWDYIEILYNARCYNSSDISFDNDKNYIQCYRYFLIKNKDQSEIVFINSDSQKENKFYNIFWDKNIVDNFADSLLNLKQFNDFIPKKIGLHEGGAIKMRISKGNISKTVVFFEIHDGSKKCYQDLYLYLNTLLITGKNNETNDTISVLKSMNEFIRYSQKIDTLYYFIPVKRISPVIVNEPIRKSITINLLKKINHYEKNTPIIYSTPFYL